MLARGLLLGLLALVLAAGGAAALSAPDVASLPCPAPCGLAEAASLAEALPLPAPPVEAPAVVVEAPLARVVQPLLGAAEPVLGPAPRLAAMPAAPTPDDVAAIVADVAPAPAVPPVVAEPYLFPRDEPTSPVALPALPEAAAAPAPPPWPQALAPAAPAPLPLAEGAAAAALLLAGAALYVRLAPAEVMDSATRQRILAAVRADPGCTTHTVARACLVDYKTAQHHLRVLRRAGFVQARRGDGRLERYFVAGDLPPGGQDAALALRSPAARALADALAQGARARAADLARALAISEATASVQLRRLEAAGLAARGRDGLWAAA